MIDPQAALKLISEVRKKKAEYEQSLTAFSNALSIPLDVARLISDSLDSAGKTSSDNLRLSPIQRAIADFVKSRPGVAVSNAEICSHMKKTPKMLIPHMKNLVEIGCIIRMRRGYYAWSSSSGPSQPARGGSKPSKKSKKSKKGKDVNLLERNPTCKRIYNAMNGVDATIAELVKKTKKSAAYVYHCLAAMKKEGLIKNNGRAVYGRA